MREAGTSHRRTGTVIQNVEPGAGADMEANDTQGQLALGVWYTMERQVVERGRLVAEWVLERGAWDDTQGQLWWRNLGAGA